MLLSLDNTDAYSNIDDKQSSDKLKSLKYSHLMHNRRVLYHSNKVYFGERKINIADRNTCIKNTLFI